MSINVFELGEIAIDFNPSMVYDSWVASMRDIFDDACAFVERFHRLEDALKHRNGITPCAYLGSTGVFDEGLECFANDEAILFDEILDGAGPACWCRYAHSGFQSFKPSKQKTHSTVCSRPLSIVSSRNQRSQMVCKFFVRTVDIATLHPSREQSSVCVQNNLSASSCCFLGILFKHCFQSLN